MNETELCESLFTSISCPPTLNPPEASLFEPTAEWNCPDEFFKSIFNDENNLCDLSIPTFNPQDLTQSPSNSSNSSHSSSSTSSPQPSPPLASCTAFPESRSTFAPVEPKPFERVKQEGPLIEKINLSNKAITINSMTPLFSEAESKKRPIEAINPATTQFTGEDRHVKRQKRLIKNRESAQLSRQRKKVYIEELEKKVNNLAVETDSLTQKNGQLAKENLSLKEEVAQLRNMLKEQHGYTSTQSQGYQKPKLSQNSTLATSRNTKAAGICLMILLFSFGLFLNSNSPAAQKSEFQTTIPGRNLHDYQEPAIKETKSFDAIPSVGPLVGPAPYEKLTNTIPKNPKEELLQASSNQSGSSRTKRERDYDLDVTQSPLKKRRDDDYAEYLTMDNQAGDEKALVPLREDERLARSQWNPSPRPHTSYFYCPAGQRIFPASAQPSEDNDDEPSIISLLVPSEFLNGSGDASIPQSLIEVSCQILDINIIPLPPLEAQTAADSIITKSQ